MGKGKRQDSMWLPSGCAQTRDVQMGWVWLAELMFSPHGQLELEIEKNSAGYSKFSDAFSPSPEILGGSALTPHVPLPRLLQYLVPILVC